MDAVPGSNPLCPIYYLGDAVQYVGGEGPKGSHAALHKQEQKTHRLWIFFIAIFSLVHGCSS